MGELLSTIPDDILSVIQALITIGLWEWFGRDFATWDGFGTPFRRKNRKPNNNMSGGE